MAESVGEGLCKLRQIRREHCFRSAEQADEVDNKMELI